MRANVGWLRGLRPGRADAMLRCILPVFFWRVLGWSVGLAGAFTSMRRLKRAKTGAHTATRRQLLREDAAAHFAEPQRLLWRRLG